MMMVRARREGRRQGWDRSDDVAVEVDGVVEVRGHSFMALCGQFWFLEFDGAFRRSLR